MTPTFEQQLNAHEIVHKGPAEDFFEGALLGNGAMGCVVTTRPDAIHVFFGHNNVWDRRVPDVPESGDDTFQKVFEKIRSLDKNLPHLLDDPWFQQHFNYNFMRYGEISPRPLPCGSIVLGFDRRICEVLGHKLSISNGMCRVELLANRRRVFVEIFVEYQSDRLWIRTVDRAGRPARNPFDRVAVYPDPSIPTEFPKHSEFSEPEAGRLGFRQILPACPTQCEDRFLQLELRCSGSLEDRRVPLNVNHPWRYKNAVAPDLDTLTQQTPPLEKYFLGTDPLVVVADLTEGTQDIHPAPGLPSAAAWKTALTASSRDWAEFWNASGVCLGDSFLEEAWYRNNYFLNCVLKPGVTCPGIFGNWMYDKTGTAWHGDYHFNYNTQQLFWGCFSGNHPEKHLPYVEMVETYLLPMAEAWAREYYNMRGACFPYCAVPVHMEKPFLLGADWSWGVGISAWVVQSFWWHYLYTGDTAFLADRAHPILRAATVFLVDYLSRPECQGTCWGDDFIHVFPSLSQELYRIRPGFAFNRDAIPDLVMIRFLFRAFEKSCEVLCHEDANLLASVSDILRRLVGYPIAETREGPVFVSVPGENPEVVHNTPQPLMPVFPGDEHGLHSDPKLLEMARRTYRSHRNEGGNDLVFFHMQGARLGCLDLERFKRQIRYCLLPNGTCTDMNLSSGGRHGDLHSFSFMKRMGIWIENFGLPAVINECLLQSYNGPLRLFPNWPRSRSASFHNLRAAGGFLVSAEIKAGHVIRIEVLSERGNPLEILNPWAMADIRFADGSSRACSDRIIRLESTRPGERIFFAPLNSVPPESRRERC